MPDSDLLKLPFEISESSRFDQALLNLIIKDLGEPISRAQLKRFLRLHPAKLDGRSVSGADLVSSGKHVVEISGWKSFLASISKLTPAQECTLAVLYEDQDLLILNKPSGIPSVSLSGDDTRSAASAALAHWPALAEIEGTKPLEPGLLHRLDTGTSGVLVFAKSADEFQRLKQAWKTPQIRKTYRALVRVVPGAPKPDCCILRSPIAHPKDSSKRMLVLDESSSDPRRKQIRGKPLAALTEVRSVREVSKSVYELEIDIQTGVMHQIRVHLANQGWPILGDSLYHGSPAPRLMLHAWRIELPLKSGAVLSLQTLLPKEFQPGT